MRLPNWLDKAISFVIVSPAMHKVHHHYKRPETDTNYGNIFPFWDWIFRTYSNTPADGVKYGLDILESRETKGVRKQLTLPFDKTI